MTSLPSPPGCCCPTYCTPHAHRSLLGRRSGVSCSLLSDSWSQLKSAWDLIYEQLEKLWQGFTCSAATPREWDIKPPLVLQRCVMDSWVRVTACYWHVRTDTRELLIIREFLMSSDSPSLYFKLHPFALKYLTELLVGAENKISIQSASALYLFSRWSGW